MAIDIKFSEAELSKITQYVGFFSALLSKIAVSLMKVAVPLAKNILPPLRVTAATAAINAGIKRK